MSVWLSKKSWGGATMKEGKFNAFKRRPKDASQAIRWKKSKKRTVVSRAKASRFNQP